MQTYIFVLEQSYCTVIPVKAVNIRTYVGSHVKFNDSKGTEWKVLVTEKKGLKGMECTDSDTGGSFTFGNADINWETFTVLSQS